jgi:hypothetical protein
MRANISRYLIGSGTLLTRMLCVCVCVCVVSCVCVHVVLDWQRHLAHADTVRVWCSMCVGVRACVRVCVSVWYRVCVVSCVRFIMAAAPCCRGCCVYIQM